MSKARKIFGKLKRKTKAAVKAFIYTENIPKNLDQTTNEKVNRCKIGVTVPVTINDLDKDYCTGCGACYNACPSKAITMVTDYEGFYIPYLLEDKCVNCKLCVKICPVINKPMDNLTNPKCYAVMTDDDTRRKSSSGGMFTALSKYVLDKSGYVVGVTLNESFVAEHIIINREEDLDKLRGSKYVQAKTGTVYNDVKKLLIEDNYVLFTGTPCQVAGLKNYLGKEYDKLITADLLCHGTPSPKVFEKYLEDYYGIENIEKFEFRTKEYGYNCVNSVAYLKDGEKVVGNIAFDAYEKAMHGGISLKSSCVNCIFATFPRQGDFTIGDFWGISSHNPDYNDGLGTSCVIANNTKADNLLKEMERQFKLCAETPLDVAKMHNRFGAKISVDTGHKRFYELLDKNHINKALDYSKNSKYDIGVIGLWYGRNYGSMATYYALNYVLKNMGLSVLIIENALKPNTEIEYGKTHPKRIADLYYNVSQKRTIDQMHTLNTYCDAFILGSDQLWNVHLSRPYKQIYYLGFVNNDRKKIAYATSMGPEYQGTAEELVVSSYNLKRFDHISVRDAMTKATLEKRFGIESVETCDPAFLPPMEAYEELISHAKLSKTEDYILAYILDPNPEIGKMLETISIENNNKVIVILDELPKNRKRNIESLALSGNGNVEIANDVDLFEWMWYYKNSTAVVTDSFHGTIYSIVFKRPFLTLSNARRGARRFTSLLKPIKLDSRLLYSVEDLMAVRDSLKNLDFTESYQLLDRIKEFSYNWLKNAVFSDKVINNSHKVYKSYDKSLSMYNNKE